MRIQPLPGHLLHVRGRGIGEALQAIEIRIGFSAEERKRLIDLDYGYLAKNDTALKEWWDKSFKG